MSTRRAPVESTAKTRNIDVPVTEVVSLDDMERALAEVAGMMELHISHITVLGTKRYPGNRHWHLKHDAETTGCLDVTYWPEAPLLWVSIRNYEPAWVHRDGERLTATLASRLAHRANS